MMESRNSDCQRLTSNWSNVTCRLSKISWHCFLLSATGLLNSCLTSKTWRHRRLVETCLLNRCLPSDCLHFWWFLLAFVYDWLWWCLGDISHRAFWLRLVGEKLADSSELTVSYNENLTFNFHSSFSATSQAKHDRQYSVFDKTEEDANLSTVLHKTFSLWTWVRLLMNQLRTKMKQVYCLYIHCDDEILMTKTCWFYVLASEWRI